MALYEHVFIARQDVSAAQVETLIEEFTKIIENGGGSVKGHEYWGLKTMVYRIKKNRKGHYVMMNIDAESAAVAELERNQRIHEDILRNLTLKVDAFEEGPSVMMANKRDGDRRGGGRFERRDDKPHEGGPREGGNNEGSSSEPKAETVTGEAASATDAAAPAAAEETA